MQSKKMKRLKSKVMVMMVTTTKRHGASSSSVVVAAERQGPSREAGMGAREAAGGES